MCAGRDSNPRRLAPADLQSAAIDHSATYAFLLYFSCALTSRQRILLSWSAATLPPTHFYLILQNSCKTMFDILTEKAAKRNAFRGPIPSGLNQSLFCNILLLKDNFLFSSYYIKSKLIIFKSY